MKTLRRVMNWFALGLLVASVVQELRKPAAERTWQGTVLGFVPYDLRVPTLGRLRDSLWNPDDPRVLVPTAFGVGWSVNLHGLIGLVRARG